MFQKKVFNFQISVHDQIVANLVYFGAFKSVQFSVNKHVTLKALINCWASNFCDLSALAHLTAVPNRRLAENKKIFPDLKFW